MTVALNHTVVRAHDKHASVRFIARILDLPFAPQWGPFLPVQLGSGITPVAKCAEGATP